MNDHILVKNKTSEQLKTKQNDAMLEQTNQPSAACSYYKTR
jgi:hypothetical protein